MSAAALPPGVVHQTILSGNLSNPVLLFELPDGRMVVVQKSGRMFRFDPSAQPASISNYMQITDIEVGGERGVNGVALDPDFASNGYFYVFYTRKSTNRNRISRFTHLGNTADLSSEFLVWESPQNWSDCCHYGGGLVFGPDGKLYLSLGEEFDGPEAQDLTRPGGKIIRINKDGTVPADNPFVDGAGGNLDEIWAYGLRNPFRAHWDFVANRYYLGEVGGNVQETAREDLHVGRAGANYGWPYCEGNCNNPAWDAPVYDYGHTGATPNGGAIVAGFTYRGSQFPSSFVGKFFFADYAQGWIKYLTFNPDGSFASETEFATGTGAPVFLMQSQNGTIYYVDILGSVGRFTYTSGNQPPSITSATGTPAVGSAPLVVNFTATATDPESNPITYRWIFGDGTEANGASVSHTYTQNGVYTAYVQASDGSSTSLSNPIPISVGNPPVVTINAPVDGALFRAGNTVAFSGTASDPDETIPAANYRWDVLFLHNAHSHPTLEGHVGQSGSLSINTSGHDYHDSTAYQLTLTVTDSDGLTGTDTATVYPDKVNLNLSTVPAGIPVFLDGVQLATPIAYDTVISFQHVVSVAASTCVNGTSYNFSHWSDSGAQTHQVTIPEQDTSLVAHFSAGGSCDSLPTSGLVMRLETDNGVVTANGQVSAWNDLSGSGVSLTAATGDPTLVANALNGRAAVDFDGTGDKLTGNALTALPAANTDREVFMVVNYRGVGYGGVSYGTAANNQVFGLAVNPAGQLMVQGWGTPNDYVTTTPGTGSGWMIQSVSLSSNVMSHYQNGNLLASVNHTYNTVKNQFVLGAEIDGTPNVNMQVAALLVYNRALSAAERDAVISFLNEKYFTVGGNIAPVANADTASVASGGSVDINVLSNDQDSDGTLNAASVLVTSAPANGVATVNANGTITYLHSGGSSTGDSFRYTVSDDGGLTSNEATVTVSVTGGATLPTNGLVLWLEGDSGVESSNGIVTLWRDQSASQNHLTGVGDPRIATSSPSGMPVIDLDGSVARLERVGALTALPTGAANRTVVMLANYRGVGYGGFAYGQVALNKVFGAIVDPQGRLMAQAWGTTYDAATTTTATGAGWLMQSIVLQNNQMSHYRDTQLIGSRTQTYATGNSQMVLGAEIDSNPYVNMQVAAVLVYNRALTAQELTDVHSFLNAKYLTTSSNQAPVAAADGATVISGGSVAIDVLANDSDPEGALNVASVEVVAAPIYGVATVNTATGAITYTHGGASTSDSFTYRVADTQGLYSQPAAVTITATAPDATVTITTPQDGAVIVGDSVTVNYTLNGSGYNHLHLSLDGEGHNTIMDMNGVYTFTAVAPGMHTIEAELVDANHNPVSAPDASDAVSFEVVSDTGGLPATGMVLRLEADAGVAVSGTTVTGWADQSSSANHLMAAGNPQLIAGALNGKPVIDFDGNGDKLSRTVNLNALPAGNGNRTVIMLANYRSNGYGGFAYGAVANNQVFGVGLNQTGRMMVQAWGTSNDFVSTQVGNGTGWLVQSAILNNSQLSHYRGDTLIDSRSHTYGTVLNQLILGAELDSSPYLSMQVAALFIYDRALSSAEYTQVVAYLQQKYLDGSTANVAPVAANDTASVAQGGSVSVDVLANDSDSDGTVDPTSVLITQNPAAATLVVDAVAGSVLYQHNGSAGTSDSFRYRVQDDAGASSNEATVAVSVIVGNQPPVAVADSALVTIGGSVAIAVATNDSDPEGNLNPASVTVVTPPANGVVTNNGNGTLIYQHTATTAGTDSFTYTVGDVEGNQSLPATVTVEAVPVPANGLAMWLESERGVVAAGGAVTSWQDQSGNGNHLFVGAGSPALEPGIANGRPVIDFDGINDRMERLETLTAFPAGASNRSVYLVASYRSNGPGGMSFGAPSCNQTFGLGIHSQSKLMVQGWCNDVVSSQIAMGTGFQVQSAVLNGNLLRHYRNQTQINQRSITFDTVLDRLLLGSELDGSPLVSMQVAAVLVFNRALTSGEHQALVTYLSQKYLVQ